MTLAELLVAAGLFGGLMYAIGLIVVTAYSAHVSTTATATSYRDAVTTLDQLGRELRQCTHVYPALPMTPTPAAPFIMRHTGATAGQDVVSGYAFDAPAGRIYRYRYLSTYPSNPAVQESHVLAEGVQSFSIQSLDPMSYGGAQMVEVDAAVYSVQTPLMMRVQVMSL